MRLKIDILKNIWQTRFVMVCLSTLILLGCSKEFEIDLSLAVNSNELHVDDSGGETQLMIYSNREWSVKFEDKVDWASLDQLQGEGNGGINFSFAHNFGVKRKVNVVISNGLKQVMVLIIQDGVDADLTFAKSEIKIPNCSIKSEIGFTTNLDIEKFEIVPMYKNEDDQWLTAEESGVEAWVVDCVMTSDTLSFVTTANGGTESREAAILLQYPDAITGEVATKRVGVIQLSEVPEMVMEESFTEIDRDVVEVGVAFVSNLEDIYTQLTTSMEYDVADSDWIESVVFEEDNFTINLQENLSGALRTANVVIKLIDNSSKEYVLTTFAITQTNLAYKPIEAVDLRAMVAAADGSIDFDVTERYLECIVISDCDNANMENNPNTAATKIDHTVNKKTAYVQTLDGSYGFRLKLATIDDNTLERYSRVDLLLDGMTLTKEANPERYTLSNVTVDNYLVVEAGKQSDLVVKSKSIGSLADSDIYTFCSLQSVEIAMNDGSYTNANDGYQVSDPIINPKGTTGPRADCVPLSLRDNQGGHIYMLTNALTPWRRTVSGVPKGAGAFNGIVVHTKDIRYGFGTEGYMGRYQVRALSEGDIKLERGSDRSFSQTIVEWNWTDKTISRNEDNTIKANVGEGSLWCTDSRAAYYLFNDFNDVINSSNSKGAVSNSALRVNKSNWWNFTENDGYGFKMKFSTSGFAGKSNLNIAFTLGSGVGGANAYAPCGWEVRYSTNGVDFTTLPNSSFSVRPLMWWTNTGLYSNLGNSDHVFFLPDSLVGQSEVTIMLVPSSKKRPTCVGYDLAGAESGVVEESTPTSDMRMGTFAVKCNK